MLILLIFIGFVAACLAELRDMYLAACEMEEENIQKYESSYFFEEEYQVYEEDIKEGFVLAGKYTYAS